MKIILEADPAYGFRTLLCPHCKEGHIWYALGGSECRKCGKKAKLVRYLYEVEVGGDE